MKKILLLLALLLPLCLRAESPFVAGKDWLPFPAYSDRAAWAELFGPKRAFFIRRGETFGLVGESGCGPISPPPPIWLTRKAGTGK